MYFKFASIARPEYGYAINTDRYESARHGRPLSVWAREFQTYGDGMIQHSPDYHVQVDHISDFCASLAAYLLALPDQEKRGEMLRGLRVYWPDHADRRNLAFAYSLKYDEKKRDRYYCLSDRKVSSAESKRHDRRWEQIPEWADGSVEAMVRIIAPSCHDFLTVYQYYIDAFHFIYSLEHGWSKYPEELLNIDQHARGPFEAVTGILDAWRALLSAGSAVENYRKQLEQDRAAAAQPVEPAA